MDYEGLGRRIRTQRKLKGMTQKMLAEKAGISLPFYGHIERGTRKASLETLVSIANALNTTSDMLLQDSIGALRSVEEAQLSPTESGIA